MRHGRSSQKYEEEQGKLNALTQEDAAMNSQDLSLAISDLYARAISTGKITRSHRRILMDAIFSAGLDEEERSAIDRLLWSTSRGRFELIDD